MLKIELQLVSTLHTGVNTKELVELSSEMSTAVGVTYSSLTLLSEHILTMRYVVWAPLTSPPVSLEAPGSRKVTVCENELNGTGWGGEATCDLNKERRWKPPYIRCPHCQRNKTLVMTQQQMTLLSSHGMMCTRRSGLLLPNRADAIVENISPSARLVLIPAATAAGMAGHCHIGWAVGYAHL